MARLLRVEQQLTVDQLALRLALPRSTVYYWVRDLALRGAAGVELDTGYAATSVQGASDAGADVDLGAAVRAASRGASAAERTGGAPLRRERVRPTSDAAYEDALRSFDDLAAQPTFRDFVCLCITRGCTREQAKVSLSDSDPAVMRLANRWMLRLTDRSPLLLLRYEPGRSLAELRRFWGAVVGVEARTIHVHDDADRAGARISGGSPRHGVLTVAVDDPLLRARLQAWMRKTRDGWQ
jgi:hypothetical protein